MVRAVIAMIACATLSVMSCLETVYRPEPVSVRSSPRLLRAENDLTAISRDRGGIFLCGALMTLSKQLYDDRCTLDIDRVASVKALYGSFCYRFLHGRSQDVIG